MLHDFNLTLPEFFGIIVVLASFVSVWVNTKVKIARIETSTNIRIASIEVKIAEYIQRNSATMDKFVQDNKDEHREIMHDVKGIRSSIQSLDVKIAEMHQ